MEKKNVMKISKKIKYYRCKLLSLEKRLLQSSLMVRLMYFHLSEKCKFYLIFYFIQINFQRKTWTHFSLVNVHSQFTISQLQVSEEWLLTLYTVEKNHVLLRFLCVCVMWFNVLLIFFQIWFVQKRIQMSVKLLLETFLHLFKIKVYFSSFSGLWGK